VDAIEQETLDYVAICRLQASYADAVTRRMWSELDPLFELDAPVQVDTVTNAPVELVGAAGIGRFIAGAIERFEFFELVVLNVRVLAGVGTDTARSRSFTCELRQERATGDWTNAFGVYHDHLRRVDGRWRYARRNYQSLARTPPSGRAAVFPFPELSGFG
jgi:SnoaL-like domain